MKYRAIKLDETNWAVGIGTKKYFTDTVTTDQKKAERMAHVYSAQWYYNQAVKCWDDAEKNGLLEEFDDCLGDWLA